jgi:hypothetical protein
MIGLFCPWANLHSVRINPSRDACHAYQFIASRDPGRPFAGQTSRPAPPAAVALPSPGDPVPGSSKTDAAFCFATSGFALEKSCVVLHEPLVHTFRFAWLICMAGGFRHNASKCTLESQPSKRKQRDPYALNTNGCTQIRLNNIYKTIH